MSPAPHHRRRADLDALRLAAVLCLFVFHTAKVFDSDPAYHVKSPAFDQGGGLAATATALSWWIRRWQMPLLFAVAGWASVAAARAAGPARFLRRRAVRLGAPLLVGVALLCPPIKWLELASGRTLRPSGLRLVEPVELGPLELLSRFFGRADHLTWSHLWFLVYLLAFTLAALPLVAALARRPRTPSSPPSLPTALGIALLPLPALAALEVGLRPRFGDYPNLYTDAANLALFGAYFVLGALLAGSPRFDAALRHSAPACGLLLIPATAAAALTEDPTARLALGAAVGWTFVAAALGGAPRVRWPPLLSRGALPRATLAIFVLHHTPLLVLAWTVTRSALAPPAQAAILFAGSIAATALLVALATRMRWSRRILGLESVA